jgi:hypothetical protein
MSHANEPLRNVHPSDDGARCTHVSRQGIPCWTLCSSEGEERSTATFGM